MFKQYVCVDNDCE